MVKTTARSLNAMPVFEQRAWLAMYQREVDRLKESVAIHCFLAPNYGFVEKWPGATLGQVIDRDASVLIVQDVHGQLWRGYGNGRTCHLTKI